MFIKVVWYSLAGFFWVYGFISLLLYLRNLFDDLKVLKGKMIYTVIPARNEESSIEGMVSAVISRYRSADSGVGDNKIIVVDIGSTDKTAEIIKKMSGENKNVFLMTPEELNSEIQTSVKTRETK